MDISPLYVLTQEELRAEELMAEYNAKTLFCHGCLTCMEESEDYDQDYSSQSDEDDIADTALLSRTHISTSAFAFFLGGTVLCWHILCAAVSPPSSHLCYLKMY